MVCFLRQISIVCRQECPPGSFCVCNVQASDSSSLTSVRYSSWFVDVSYNSATWRHFLKFFLSLCKAVVGFFHLEEIWLIGCFFPSIDWSFLCTIYHLEARISHCRANKKQRNRKQSPCLSPNLVLSLCNMTLWESDFWVFEVKLHIPSFHLSSLQFIWQRKTSANRPKRPETSVLSLLLCKVQWNIAIALQFHGFNLLLQHLIILQRWKWA